MKTNINREILRLALPSIFSNITVPLLGLSDTFISGHIISSIGQETYIAAIAAGSMMINAIYWLFGFLRAGTTGLTAEAFGKRVPALSRRIFTISFLMASAIGLVIILLSYPLSQLMIAIISPSAEAARMAVGYFLITILAAPAQLTIMTVSGWMIGNQNTLFPMIIAIGVNIINIAISFSCVFLLEMGFYGVAVGTLSANWLGLILALILARILNRRLERNMGNPSSANSDSHPKLFTKLKGITKKIDLHRFFRVNADLMARSACIMGVTFAMTAFGGRMGDLTLAINAVVMQMFLLFSYFSDGFAYSGEALCGRFSGEGDKVALRRVIRILIFWSIGVAALFTLLYLFFTGEFAEFMTEDRAVVDGVKTLLPAICLIPVLSSTAFIMDGIYIGLTATRKMLLTGLAATATFFIINFLPYIFPGISISSNHLLWTAFLLFLALRGIILAILLPRTVRDT